jgi:flagella basal body P-ring formation protein FlgA
MTRRCIILLAAGCVLMGDAARAGEAVTATRTIRPGEVIATGDVRNEPSEAAGALTDPEDAVGMVARRLLVSGRPILEGDVGAPALVKRNGHVLLVYNNGALTIRTEGRALSDGAAGEQVRVMNLASRQTIFGTVAADGTIEVGGWR